MVEFTHSLKFIVSFLFLLILLTMFTNQKITFSFLVLVLISMLVLNPEIVESVIGGLKYE